MKHCRMVNNEGGGRWTRRAIGSVLGLDDGGDGDGAGLDGEWWMEVVVTSDGGVRRLKSRVAMMSPGLIWYGELDLLRMLM